MYIINIFSTAGAKVDWQVTINNNNGRGECLLAGLLTYSLTLISGVCSLLVHLAQTVTTACIPQGVSTSALLADSVYMLSVRAQCSVSVLVLYVHSWLWGLCISLAVLQVTHLLIELTLCPSTPRVKCCRR